MFVLVTIATEVPKYDANWWNSMNNHNYNDPCTIALQTDNNLMAIHNPYVANLVEMGYDEQDCNVASEMFNKHEFPKYIHGRYFETEQQYLDELHDFLNGM